MSGIIQGGNTKSKDEGQRAGQFPLDLFLVKIDAKNAHFTRVCMGTDCHVIPTC